MLRKSAISMGDATTKSARFPLKMQCIKVSRGERMRLRVDGINGVFAAHHRGGLCHLQLRLQTGATIDSKKVSVWPGPVVGLTRECDDGLFVAMTPNGARGARWTG
jgi:hypothetical protein